MLVVTGTTGDPSFVTRELPAVSGPVQVVIRMRALAGADGDASVFWSLQGAGGFAGNQLPFRVAPAGGAFTEGLVELPAQGPIRALRIDPARSAGITEVDFIELRSVTGEVLRTWDFGGEPAGP